MKSRSEELKEQGNKAFKSGDLTLAEDLYSQCIEANPQNHLGLANRGLVRMKLEKWELAVSDLTRCLEIKPGYVKAYLRRAKSFKMLKKRLSAYRDYRMIVEIDPLNRGASQKMDELEKEIGRDIVQKAAKKKPRVRKRSAEVTVDLKEDLEGYKKARREEKKSKEKHRIFFGQMVIGPPGSGKTTYCTGMAKYLRALGRNVAIVNLDPANDETLPYQPAVDIQELITLKDAVQEFGLGPNGGMIYCLEFLSKNMIWLRERMDQLPKDSYVIFDCPGQVELYIHHNFAREIAQTIYNKWDYRLSCINLIDSHHLSSPSNFISILLMSLSSMIHLELPHVNILSKADLIPHFEDGLQMDLDFYTQVQDLRYLLAHIPQDPWFSRFRALNDAIAETVMDFSLVSFLPLDISNRDSVKAVLRLIDQSNGFALLGDASLYEEKETFLPMEAFAKSNPLHSMMETNAEREKAEDVDYDAMYGPYEGK